MAIIQFENFSFSYPGSQKPVIKHLDFCVEAGEFITVCGQSGCGKTTLLKSLKPFLAPHGEKKGRILFNGTEIGALSQREQAEQIGYVLQSPDNQLVTDKVWHELAFGLESLGYDTKTIRGKVAEIASFFGMESWFSQKISDLSGGQKQMLNLASVMVMHPEVLVLDEPTSQLDPIAAQNFFGILARIKRELGTTIILSEHRLEEAFAMSDKVLLLDDGEILAFDVPSKVGKIVAEQNHKMLAAMPTPMQVFFHVNGDEECPITVSQGRKWLEKKKQEDGLIPVINREQAAKQKREVALELKDVWFRYEKNRPDVLKGLSLKVARGSLYAILGGNGTGKTTALSVMGGLFAANRGQVFIERVPLENIKNKYEGILGILPQNPQTLFVKNTVASELSAMLSEKNFNVEEREKKICETILLCGLEQVLERHPFDLSGGEQQRLALAKILLLSPRIILLDEPTKGMDAACKENFAKILSALKAKGVTIIMVSHDVEFCARYADCCALFFDGSIVSEEVSQKFFDDKSFYTTAASRMSGGILPGIVLAEDIIAALGGVLTAEKTKVEEPALTYSLKDIEKKQVETKKRKPLFFKILGGLFFTLLFILTVYIHITKDDFSNLIVVLLQLAELLFLWLALSCFLPIQKRDLPQKEKQKFSKRTAISFLVVFLVVPLTMFAGIWFFKDQKYYLVSILMILEILVPFFVMFEKKRPEARELVIVSVLCAMAVAGRTVLSMIPQFKPLVAIVILAGVAFGGETGFLVGAVSGFLSNFFFGQSALTPWQMFCFGIIGFVAGVLFKKGMLSRSKLSLSVFGFIAIMLLYGGIINLASLFMWQPNPTWELVIYTYVMGIPFDVIHGAATAFFLWFLAEPMLEKLDRIKTKYGILES